MAYGYLRVRGDGHVHYLAVHAMLSFISLVCYQECPLRASSIARRLVCISCQDTRTPTILGGIGRFDELSRLVRYLVRRKIPK